MKSGKSKINGKKNNNVFTSHLRLSFSKLKNKPSLLMLIEVVKSAYERVVLLFSQVLCRFTKEEVIARDPRSDDT